MSDSPERVVFHYCEHALHEECPAMMVPPVAGMPVKLCACACHREIRLVDVSEWATEYRVTVDFGPPIGERHWMGYTTLADAEKQRDEFMRYAGEEGTKYVIQSRKVGPWE